MRENRQLTKAKCLVPSCRCDFSVCRNGAGPCCAGGRGRDAASRPLKYARARKRGACGRAGGGKCGIPRVPMRGFVKGVRLRRTPSLPPSHLVPIRILVRRRGVGCLLKSVFRLPLMPRTHRSECRNAVTGTGCKLTLDRRPSSTFAAFSNQNPSLHFRSFLLKSQMPSSYSRLVHHVPIRILSR